MSEPLENTLQAVNRQGLLFRVNPSAELCAPPVSRVPRPACPCPTCGPRLSAPGTRSGRYHAARYEVRTVRIRTCLSSRDEALVACSSVEPCVSTLLTCTTLLPSHTQPCQLRSHLASEPWINLDNLTTDRQTVSQYVHLRQSLFAWGLTCRNAVARTNNTGLNHQESFSQTLKAIVCGPHTRT